MKQFTVTVKGEEVTFESPHQTLDDAIEAIKQSGNRSEFARDLIKIHAKYGLSDKQAAWAHRLATQPPRETREPMALGLTNIALMLRNLPGKKRPKLEVANGVVVTLNSDKSKNPGHVSVTDGGPYGESVYFGRIDPDSGTVYPGRDFTDEVLQALVAFNNQNPQESNDIDDDDLPF
jgi:hypothetical protein